MPGDDAGLLDTLVAAFNLAREEWGGAVSATIKHLDLEDLLAIDLALAHEKGFASEVRFFLCNRPTQGGGFKRQLDRALPAMKDKACFMLRASDFPPNSKNQTGQAFRKFRENGGRSLLVPIADWERMMMVREFHAQHRQDPGFLGWFKRAKLLSEIPVLVQLLRLDLFRPAAAAPKPEAQRRRQRRAAQARGGSGRERVAARDAPRRDRQQGRQHPGWPPAGLGQADHAQQERAEAAHGRARRIRLGQDHAGALHHRAAPLRGTPVVLIDRKGDLCSYANPDVWRSMDGEGERRGQREKLADSIDVAVYTPGRASGRPISITLLPNGINELPDQEQQLLANLSAAALGDMLHFKNSATHQKQSGTLSVALRLLGSRFSKEVTLTDLIHLLEEEDPELTELTQRMDPSGRIRRDLVAQLDSLRHRNASLFEGGGEALRMDSLLGRGRHARSDNRTRLSIIYTGFLGDNENILFWVAQFLSEALRFCQRNPNDELQAVVMFDEADLYIPANAKPATAEPLQSLLKRARSAGLGIMLATQSPGDLDYKSRDQITSWFIGRVREDTALRKLKAAFQSESGLDPQHRAAGRRPSASSTLCRKDLCGPCARNAH